MDYAHARHAGNAGDVHKHAALVALVEQLTREGAPLRYVETHAGDGVYPLASVGEWTSGALKVLADREGLVGRYAALVRRESPEKLTRYPGSPLLARALLRPQDAMLLHELDPQSAAVLRRTVASAEVRQTDGLSALPELVAHDRVLALIDPPYAQKQEWTEVARALIGARARSPEAALLLWYPVKALTRPRALIGELARGGVHGIAVELHWTPLRLQRDRLNGSGVIFSGCPRTAIESFLGAQARLGEALNTHGEWHGAQIGF